MQVISFEYDVPTVLVSLCIKFDKDPMRKHDLLTFCFVDLL
jgi:hypothetical protein